MKIKVENKTILNQVQNKLFKKTRNIAIYGSAKPIKTIKQFYQNKERKRIASDREESTISFNLIEDNYFEYTDCDTNEVICEFQPLLEIKKIDGTTYYYTDNVIISYSCNGGYRTEIYFNKYTEI